MQTILRLTMLVVVLWTVLCCPILAASQIAESSTTEEVQLWLIANDFSSSTSDLSDMSGGEPAFDPGAAHSIHDLQFANLPAPPRSPTPPH